MREALRRLRALVGRRALEDGLDEELRFHVEQQTAKHVRAGMTPDEARRQAGLRLGGIDLTKEATRDEVRLAAVEDTWRDLRYACRSLGRAPAFTLAAVLTLGLGLGATTAIFSVVYGVLLKPLPYPDESRLVSLSHDALGIDARDMGMAASLWFVYREENRMFDAVGLWAPGVANVTGPEGPAEVPRVTVTHDALDALGVSPLLGRRITARDDEPGAPPVVLLTWAHWQQRYGGDPAVIGRNLTVDGDAHEIIGIMPRGFRVLLAEPDIILPARLSRPDTVLGGFNFGGVARLRSGVTLDQARADLVRMLGVWLESWPTPPGIDRSMFVTARFVPLLTPLKERVVGNVSQMLWVVMATIVIVWLIACANVANLLLVRAEGRQQELAVRAALGAGSGRIARALMAEHLILGALGGLVGTGVAYATIRTIRALEPVGLPRVDELGLDPVVLLFVGGASVVSGLLFGALPVMRHGRPQAALALRGSGRTMSDSRERHRTRGALVVVQVSLALVLLAAAGLMVRSFLAMRAVLPGFTSPETVQTLGIVIPGAEVEDNEQVTRVQQALVERFAAVAGVTSVSFASSAPLGGTSYDPVLIEGRDTAAGETPPVKRYRFIAPGFFDTLGTRIVAGRDVTWADLHQRHAVALVSEGFARATWGDPANAIGRRIRERNAGIWRDVVGVVEDVRDAGMHQPAPDTVYWPALMSDFWGNATRSTRSATFVVRSARAGSDGLLDDLRNAMRDVSGNLPIGRTRTLAEIYERSMAVTSFALVMLAIAAGMALALGVIGIYGVMSYAVARRTREIGIRLALGAQPGRLRGMFVRDGVMLAAIGVACGLVAAFAVTRVMTSLLFGVSAIDPLTYGVGALVLLAAAALASFIPTTRATRTSLASVLRAE